MEDVSGDECPELAGPEVAGPPGGWPEIEWRDGPRSGRFVPSVVDALVFPDDAAAWAAGTVPCVEGVVPAGISDLGRLSAVGRLDTVVAIEHHLAWIQALQLRALAAFTGDPAPGGDPDLQADPPHGKLTSGQVRERLDKDWIREDVRAALGESALGAGNRIRLARELTGRLAPTLTALQTGRVTMRHARYLTEALAGHTDHTATQVQDRVLPKLVGPVSPPPDMGSFRRRTRRAILKADPRRAEEQRAAALADRRVSVTDNGDGTSSVFALLPTEGAALLMAALNLIARQHAPDDTRTPDLPRKREVPPAAPTPCTNSPTTG